MTGSGFVREYHFIQFGLSERVWRSHLQEEDVGLDSGAQGAQAVVEGVCVTMFAHGDAGFGAVP